MSIFNTNHKHKTGDTSFVPCLFDLASSPSLHISLDAIKTLQYLFTSHVNNKKNDKLISDYLYKNKDWIFNKFNHFINSDNTVMKRQFFNLLNQLLTKEANFDILMLYIVKHENLSIAKRILTDKFIISKTDHHHHNLIIDELLEELIINLLISTPFFVLFFFIVVSKNNTFRYFEECGDILEEIASRTKLSNLLLNNTFITRLQEDSEIIDLNEVFNDMKENEEKEKQQKSQHKDLGKLLGTTSSKLEVITSNPPSLNETLSISSMTSDASFTTTPNGTKRMKTRYTGDDIPCFKRSPQHNISLKQPSKNHNHDNDDDDEKVMERLLIFELISLINRSCSNLVANYSFNVLSKLLMVNKDKSANFLIEHYDELIKHFQQLINIGNHNKYRQRKFLRLLKDLLLENNNNKFRKKFKSQLINLQIIMNLLKSKDEIVVYDAFHIFAIFVTSKHKTREIHIVLWRNTKQNNLINFIKKLLPNKAKKYGNLEEEKNVVINSLNQLPTPKSDESFLKLPMI